MSTAVAMRFVVLKNAATAATSQIARSSNPMNHQTIEANNASSSTTPTSPIEENVARTKKSHAPSSTIPAITTSGWTGDRFAASQWK